MNTDIRLDADHAQLLKPTVEAARTPGALELLVGMKRTLFCARMRFDSDEVDLSVFELSGLALQELQHKLQLAIDHVTT